MEFGTSPSREAQEPRLSYRWGAGSPDQTLTLVAVPGTGDHSFAFGEEDATRPIAVQTFYMTTVPVIQALWKHMMGGANPSCHPGDLLPVENASWEEIARPGGFLDRINASPIPEALARQGDGLAQARLRLPTKVEWEYAARGGPHWPDGFRFSGGNIIEKVAWYEGNSGPHP